MSSRPTTAERAHIHCAEMADELSDARDRLLGRMKDLEASCTLLGAIIDATQAHADD
jgi:hypothetical protein